MSHTLKSALSMCLSCGKENATTAKNCHRCGTKLVGGRPLLHLYRLALLLMLIAVIGGGMAILYQMTSPSTIETALMKGTENG